MSTLLPITGPPRSPTFNHDVGLITKPRLSATGRQAYWAQTLHATPPALDDGKRALHERARHHRSPEAASEHGDTVYG